MSARLSVDIAVRRASLTVAVAFELAAGERLAVMGPSGAGKTTVLEAVAGLAPVTRGRVAVDGETVAAPRRQVAPQRRGTVLLRQDPGLFPHLSVGENVAFGLRSRGAGRARARAVADEMLERVGLGGAGPRAPRELSGGQQQRVALARAIAAGPRVILLDEPFTALDPETASALRSTLADQLSQTGTTTVFVTHDALDAVAVADRLLVIEDGAVTQSGPVRAVLGAPATRFGAAVAGVNRLTGTVRAGRWSSGGLTLPAVGRADGDAVVLVRPADIRLDAGADPGAAPDGAPARAADRAHGFGGESVSWTAAVARLEPTIAGVRVHVSAPDLAVDVPVTRAAELRPGAPVRLSLDATDLAWA